MGQLCDANGNHYTCSPPKECCRQGCCFLLTLGPSYRPPPPGGSLGTIFNPLFLGHWYFWLAVTATVVGILCACSLWRRHTQGGICCRNSVRDERASEPDSNGSCYAPPQYSRCNSFHQPPPPYSEVTSKPDLYPLVINYNGDPVIKTNNGSTRYLMVQYFRNFIVRPVGSLSATTTIDSLSSSFTCNATNDANTIIPPPYSSMISLEELPPEQFQSNGGVNTPLMFTNTQSPLRFHPQQPSGSDFHNLRDNLQQVIIPISPSLESTLAQAGLISTPIRRPPSEKTTPVRSRPHSVVSIRDNPVFLQGENGGSLENRGEIPQGEKNNRKLSMPSGTVSLLNYTPLGSDFAPLQSVKTSPIQVPREDSCTLKPVENNQDRQSYSPLSPKKDNVSGTQSTQLPLSSLGSSPVHNAKINARTSKLSNNNQTKRKVFKDKSQESEDSGEPNFSDLLNLSVCVSTPAGMPTNNPLLCSVTNSMTGSDISSLANLGTPDSPPRATSPTSVEMKQLLDKIQQLPQQKSPLLPNGATFSFNPNSSATPAEIRQNKLLFHKSKAKTMYMPLNEEKTQNRSTKLFSKGWLSRSAPNTPCGNFVPNFPVHKRNPSNGTRSSRGKLEDSNPLLLHDENDESDDYHSTNQKS